MRALSGRIPYVIRGYKNVPLTRVCRESHPRQDAFGKSHGGAKGSGSLKTEILIPFLPLNTVTVNRGAPCPFLNLSCPTCKIEGIAEMISKALPGVAEQWDKSRPAVPTGHQSQARRARGSIQEGAKGVGHPGVKTNLPPAKFLLSLALHTQHFWSKAFFSETVLLKKGERKKIQPYDNVGKIISGLSFGSVETELHVCTLP